MKSFTDVNRKAGTKGFRPDEHPAPVANNDIKGKKTSQSSSRGIKNPFGDNDGANSK